MFVSRLFWSFSFFLCVAAKGTPFLPLSWMFDWAPPTELVPVPTVAQCETVNITWTRGSATGPSGTAPYRLVVYTSAFVTPFIVPAGSGSTLSWAVPFIPGTQFQVCMFDKNGNTGGCQRMYTVTTSRNETLGQPVSCQNVTFPAHDQVLDVAAQMDTGPISQYGWPDQCTDLQFTPKNGTPPYTLTVAPTLRPPYNITWDTTSLNWTIILNWGSSFFFSIEDSKGNTWSQGPLHAGGNGPTHCLDLNPPKVGVRQPVAIGAGFAALITGTLLGILAAWYWLYRKVHPHPSVVHGGEGKRSFDSGDSELGYDRTNRQSDLSQHVNPFVQTGAPSNVGRKSDDASFSSPTITSPASSQPAPGHVYVVHHDGGRAPVTVYTEQGTEVVELPPRYNTPMPSPAPPGQQQQQQQSSNLSEKERIGMDADAPNAGGSGTQSYS